MLKLLKELFFLSRWHHVRWLRRALKNRSGKVLDIGSGKGKVVGKAIKDRDNIDLVKLDIKRGRGWRIDIVADGRKIPVKAKEFDGALILDVLEHVKNPEEIIKEAARVVKDDGWLHLSVPLEGSRWVLDE
jgi:ubiquinone/menaquinone biosynthesis C-methylase UbiE